MAVSYFLSCVITWGVSSVPCGVLTCLFDEGIMVADYNAVQRCEDVELDDVHAKPNRLDERRHRVALNMPVATHHEIISRGGNGGNKPE